MRDRPVEAEEIEFSDEEAALENAEQSLREVDELVEDCDNRLTFGAFDIRERYADGNLQILLKLGLSGEGGEVYAILQRAEGFGTHLERVIARKCPSKGPQIGGMQGQGLVFVTQVQFVQEIEEVIPSTVRLEPIDQLSSGGGELSYFLWGAGFVSGSIFCEGKGDTLHRFSVSNGEAASEVIKCCSEVVDSIPCHESDFDRRRFSNLEDCYTLPFIVRVGADSEVAGNRASIVGNSLFRLLDQGFGPFNL